ncbi:conserved hypothetical protein [delta proteobacterium NaphS2]|nr:conserved hypothetical protein [delta proteobacterium NaphS2]
MKETISLKAIARSIQELHRTIDCHHSEMVSILGQEKIGVQTDGHSDMKFSAYSREAALRNVIREAVEVLEESRKAFKSKRLEALRKRLTNALMDIRA